MEADIRDALTDLKESVRDGFRVVNERIDNLVTKGEFNATVQRLDAQHGTLRRDVETNEVQARTTADAVRAELRGELEKMRATYRWAVALLVPAAGVVAAVVFGVLNLVIN